MFRTRILLFFGFTFFNVCCLSAQDIFREGYIIKNNGDYFEGLIEYKQGNKLPSKCVFKSFDIAVPVTFTADGIKSFGYRNGQRYESIKINDKNEFLETIVSGDLTLYKAVSGYYVRKNGFQIININKANIEWVDENGQKVFNNINELISFLTNGSQNPGSDKDEARIIAAVQAYNKRSGKDFIAYNRNFSPKEIATRAIQTGVGSGRKGIVAGINMYSLKLNWEKYYLPSPEPQKGITFGLMYEHTISGKTDRLLFHSEALFLKQDFYSYYETTETFGRSVNDTYYSFTAIKFPLLIQYSLTGGNVTPFINTGFAISYLAKTDYLHIAENEIIARHYIYTASDKFMKLQKAEASFIMGGGVKLRFHGNLSLNLEARMEAGTGLFKEPNTAVLKQFSLQPGFLASISF